MHSVRLVECLVRVLLVVIKLSVIHLNKILHRNTYLIYNSFHLDY